MDSETEATLTPEAIAETISTAVKSGRVKTLRDIAPLVMEECQVAEADALAIAEAVSRKWQSRLFPPITRMELFLTENCNLRCDYCFVHGKNAFRRMSWQTARQAVDFLFAQSGDKKQLYIFFMGGEPFLEFDLMRQVVEYAEGLAKQSDRQLEFSVTTNGTVLTEEVLQFCAQHGIKFLLSLDGAPATHDRHRRTAGNKGSAEMIVNGLPLMKRYQPWMGARVTVHPDAVHEIAQNVRYLVDRGMNYFIIGPASGIPWLDEDLAVYEAQMTQVIDDYREELAKGNRLRIDLLRDLEQVYDKRGIWGCQAGRHSIAVAASGDIYACSKMLGLNDLAGIYRLGDLGHGITEVDARAELVSMWPKRETKCMTCELADACTGGCFATNYEATGSAFEPCATDCRVLAHNFRIREYARRMLGKRQTEGTKDEEACAV